MINRLLYSFLVCFLIIACDSAGPSPSELVPVAVNDTIQAREVDPPGVLANDVDPDNPVDPDDPEYKLEATKVSGLENGSVVVEENGKVVIDSISEDRTFKYKVEDMNNGKSDTATVKIDETVE